MYRVMRKTTPPFALVDEFPSRFSPTLGGTHNTKKAHASLGVCTLSVYGLWQTEVAMPPGLAPLPCRVACDTG